MSDLKWMLECIHVTESSSRPTLRTATEKSLGRIVLLYDIHANSVNPLFSACSLNFLASYNMKLVLEVFALIQGVDG